MRMEILLLGGCSSGYFQVKLPVLLSARHMRASEAGPASGCW